MTRLRLGSRKGGIDLPFLPGVRRWAMPSEQSAGSAVGAAAAASRARGLAAVGSVCAGCLAPASSETRITVFFRYLRHVRGHSARYQDILSSTLQWSLLIMDQPRSTAWRRRTLSVRSPAFSWGKLSTVTTPSIQLLLVCEQGRSVPYAPKQSGTTFPIDNEHTAPRSVVPACVVAPRDVDRRGERSLATGVGGVCTSGARS